MYLFIYGISSFGKHSRLLLTKLRDVLTVLQMYALLLLAADFGDVRDDTLGKYVHNFL